jgi:hypothetical protein
MYFFRMMATVAKSTNSKTGFLKRIGFFFSLHLRFFWIIRLDDYTDFNKRKSLFSYTISSASYF